MKVFGRKKERARENVFLVRPVLLPGSPIFPQLHHHHQVILASVRVWYFLISFRSGGVIHSDSHIYFFADSKFHIPFYKESINDYPRLLFFGLLDHSISLWSLSVLKVNEGMGG